MNINARLYYLSLKNIIRRVFFSKSTYLLLSLSYLILSIILYQSANVYLNSDGKNIFDILIVPYMNSLNVIITFVFIFGSSEYLDFPKGKIEFRNNLRLNTSGLLDQLILLTSSIIYSMVLIAPAFFQVVIINLVVQELSIEMFFPLLGTLLLHILVFSWMTFVAKLLKNKIATVLVSFLLIGIYTFLNSYSSLVNNLFFSNLLREISFVSHLELITSGVFRARDLAYFISWPLIFLIINSFYFETRKFKADEKSFVFRTAGALGVITVLIMINFIIAKNDMIADFSRNKIMSLSSESKREISTIQKNVKGIIFSSSTQIAQIKKLTSLYENQNELIEFLEVDPDQRPDLVTKYRIDRLPALVITSGEGKFHVIKNINEQSLTSGILQSSELRRQNVFLFTDNEADLNKLSGLKKRLLESFYIVFDGYKLIAQKGDNYIHRVSLDLNDTIKEKIDKLINLGAHITILISPNINGRFVKWREYLLSYGIDINNHFAIDTARNINGSKGTVPFVSNPVLYNGIEFNGKILFPLAAALSLNTDSLREVESKNVVTTSQGESLSWGESNIDEVSRELFYHAGDIQGPVGLITDSLVSNKGTLTVISSAEFLDNKYSKISSNIEYFSSLLKSRSEVVITQTVATNLSSIYKKNIRTNLAFYVKYIFCFPFIFVLFFVFIKRKYD